MGKMYRGLLVNISLLIMAILGAYFIPRFVPVYSISDFFFSSDPLTGVGDFVSFESTFNYYEGILITFIFLITFLFTFLGDGKKYYWIGGVLLPVLIFFLLIIMGSGTGIKPFLSFILFISIAIIGWVSGFLLKKLLRS